jgi:hypothetical protein
MNRKSMNTFLVFFCLIISICVALVAAIAGNDPCSFLSTFRSGKLPNAPESRAAALFFVLVAGYLIFCAIKFDVLTWSLKRQILFVPEYMISSHRIADIFFGLIRANIRIYFVYPITLFFFLFTFFALLRCEFGFLH